MVSTVVSPGWLVVHEMVPLDQDGTGTGWYAIHHAAFYGDCKKIHTALELGIHIDIRSWSEDTPLHMASVSPWSDVATVELLVASGANVFARDCNGKLPIDNICINTKEGYDKSKIIHAMMQTLV